MHEAFVMNIPVTAVVSHASGCMSTYRLFAKGFSCAQKMDLTNIWRTASPVFASVET